jgi:hypothetical protein
MGFVIFTEYDPYHIRAVADNITKCERIFWVKLRVRTNSSNQLFIKKPAKAGLFIDGAPRGMDMGTGLNV